MEIFTLEPLPAPTKRAQQGQKDRQSLACSVRDKAYNPLESFFNCWRNGRTELPKKAAAALGIRTVQEGLDILQPSLIGMMQFMGVTTLEELLPLYGRTGTQCWQFDHKRPIRQIDAHDPADMASGFNLANVRLRIAARNKRKKWEPPEVHDELNFSGEEAA